MTYVPDRGDVVWLDCSPQVGREQAGRRPTLVLSPARYNGRVGLAVVCPVTSKAKGFPFEVVIPDGFSVTGVILSDQAKSIDWQGRNAEYRETLPEEVVAAVVERFSSLIQL